MGVSYGIVILDICCLRVAVSPVLRLTQWQRVPLITTTDRTSSYNKSYASETSYLNDCTYHLKCGRLQHQQSQPDSAWTALESWDSGFVNSGGAE